MEKETETKFNLGQKLSIETLNHAVQVLAIAIGGIWAISVFVYHDRIVPSLAPPTISVTNSLAKVGQKGNLIAIRSRVNRSNVGRTSVQILALTYNVVGIKTDFGAKPATEAEFSQVSARSATVRAARYYTDPGEGEVILREGILFKGATQLPSDPSTLNPGESVARDFVFYVDRSKFDSICFLVKFSYTKLNDPPVPLVLKINAKNLLIADPSQPCPQEFGRCREVTTTDFPTEFSLW